MQELDVVKDTYQKIERQAETYFQWSCLTIYLYMLALSIASPFVRYQDLTSSEGFEFGGLIVTYIVISAAYCSVKLNLMRQMYRYHRFAFRSHIKRMAVIACLTCASLWAIVCFQILGFYYWLCRLSTVKGSGGEPMYDPEAENPGMCNWLLFGWAGFMHDTNRYGAMTCYYDCLILVPVLSFFILDEPHDCFQCLGKDPARNYSVF